MARALNLTLDFRACSGAITGDYWSPRDALAGLPPKDVDDWNHELDGRLLLPQSATGIPAGTRLVTVGFGGNNAHFAAAVLACIATGANIPLIDESLAEVGAELRLHDLEELAGDSWDPKSCTNFLYKLQGDLRVNLAVSEAQSYKSLEGVYRHVREHAPGDARVLVIGYPRVFPFQPEGSCGLGTGGAVVDEDEQRAVNALIMMINSYIKTAATAAGVEYVDIENEYTPVGARTGSQEDHGLCRESDADRWIHRFRIRDLHANVYKHSGTAHPTIAGQSVAAEAVLRCYRDEASCGNFAELNAARNLAQMKQLSYPHAGCPTREEWAEEQDVAEWDAATVTTEGRDITGDGRDEVLVKLSCPSVTSSWPEVLVLWDVTARDPKHLLTVDDYYFRGASHSISGSTITMEGPTIGGTDSFCCPEHWARVRYRWADGRFEQDELIEIINPVDPTTGMQPPVDLRTDGFFPDGIHYGVVRGVSGNRIAIDPIELYEGEEARLACAREGVAPEPEIGWCTDIYRGNSDDVLQALEVTADAKLLLYLGGPDFAMESRPISDLHTLEDLGKVDTSWPFFALTLRGGKVVALEESFFVS